MPQATRKKFDENAHFLIEKDVIAGKTVRFVLSCKRCKKQKLFPGEPKTIHQICCNRTIEFQPATGKLPPPESTEAVVPPESEDAKS